MSSLPGGIQTSPSMFSARDLVDSLANESVNRWRRNGPGEGAAEVERCLAEIEAALALCDGRKGARVNAAREWLESEAKRLRDPLEAWKSWDSTVEWLVSELGAAREAADLAAVKYQHANPSQAVDAFAAREAAAATVRGVEREIAKAVEAIHCPHIPARALGAIDAARTQTLNLAAIKQPARRIHAACDQGAKASCAKGEASAARAQGHAVAKLWAVFETDAKLSKDFDLRYARFEEA